MTQNSPPATQVRPFIGRSQSIIFTVPLALTRISGVLNPPDATPPMWNVRIVSWVPGSPMDCAAMIPTESPIFATLLVAGLMP